MYGDYFTQNKLPKRKVNRLKHFEYNTSGSYFITICVKDRRPILSNIIANETIGLPPIIHLTRYGEIVEKSINKITECYSFINVENYVIMPDHIHLLLRIRCDENGMPIKTIDIKEVIRQFKGYVTKQIGISIWQKSFFDHIIRNSKDFDETNKYIFNNPSVYLQKRK